MAVARAGAPAPAAAQGVPMQRIAFVAAAHEHTEPAFTQVVTPAASAQEFGPFDVPAYGYLRHILISVTGAGGALGGGALAADYPWNIFETIRLLDVNGSPIFELDGYAALWANIIGGYAFEQDPRTITGFDGTIVTPRFYLRIPVEINHFDALGAISNQNSAAAYKVSFRVRPSTSLVVGGTPTMPTLTVRGELEAWSLPNEVDLAGRPQNQQPPLHGTSQYWSSYVSSTVAGSNTIRLNRVGNMIRNVVVIARTAAGVRQDNVFPDPITLQWDANNLLQETQLTHLARLEERINNLSARDAGVFIYSYSHSELGRSGDGPANLWLPTVQSSRLEIQGVTVTAGSWQVVTNDVAPVEIDPAERYESPSRTGGITAPGTVRPGA